MMEPGEIFWADLESGRRPVVIVSREDLNRGSYAVAVLCTTQKFVLRSTRPNCVPLYAGEFGLPYDCVAQCESVLSLRRTAIDTPIGRLDDERLRDVIKAVGYVMEADCEPC